MTKFIDGPAAGQVLMLRRAPMLLRLVQSPKGAWDALDQLDDVPAEDELIIVYRRIGAPNVIHVDVRGRGGRREGLWYQSAEYRVVAMQPGDWRLRTTPAWREWCLEQQSKEPASCTTSEQLTAPT